MPKPNNSQTNNTQFSIQAVPRSLVNYLGEFFAQPPVVALCQQHYLTASFASYLGGKYQQEQFDSIIELMHQLNARLTHVERTKIDQKFLNSPDGKRIIGKIFRAISRDNRIEKIIAMSNLTVNLYLKSKLTVDEKEIYVDILDRLNILQLSILQNAVLQVKSRTQNQHRGFGWEEMQKEYQSKGITGALLLQSIRVLESNGLVNENPGAVTEIDRTHLVTFFGEQFYAFISDSETKKNPYIL